jgi:hypothetical protein
MALITFNQIIEDAMFDAGIFGQGQVPSAVDINLGLRRLNYMLATWSATRPMMFHTLDIFAQSTGLQSYKIGTGQFFNTARPMSIQTGCFARQVVGTLNIDYPLRNLYSREDYNRITLKNMASFPQYIFYDSANDGVTTVNTPGYGYIFVWPEPSNIYELHVQVQAQLGQVASLSSVFNLPEVYQECIMYNLMQRLRIAYRKPPDPEINKMALMTYNIVCDGNAQIPELMLPDTFNQSSSIYNVYSDTR